MNKKYKGLEVKRLYMFCSYILVTNCSSATYTQYTVYNTSYTYNLYRIHALCLNTNDLSVYSLYSYNIYFRKSKSFIICCLVYLYFYIQKLFRLGGLGHGGSLEITLTVPLI